MAALNAKQLEMCSTSEWDFSDPKALFINCTLKRSPELSHTQGPIDISKAILEENDVSVDVMRAVDHDIAYGVWPDMTEHGWETDEWPGTISKRSSLKPPRPTPAVLFLLSQSVVVERRRPPRAHR